VVQFGYCDRLCDVMLPLDRDQVFKLSGDGRECFCLALESGHAAVLWKSCTWEREFEGNSVTMRVTLLASD
jgi:hypothetical protein